MLDCSSGEYFIILYSLKQRSACITFSNNQFLSQSAEYNVLLLRYSNLYTSTVNDNALPTSGLSHPFLGMGPGPMELGKLAAF